MFKKIITKKTDSGYWPVRDIGRKHELTGYLHQSTLRTRLAFSCVPFPELVPGSNQHFVTQTQLLFAALLTTR